MSDQASAMADEAAESTQGRNYATEVHYHLIEHEIAYSTGTGAYARYRQHLTGPLEEGETLIHLLTEMRSGRYGDRAWFVGPEERCFLGRGRTVSVVPCIRNPCDRPVRPFAD